MKNIKNLINLEENEEILQIVQDQRRSVYISQLDKKYFNIEKLPSSFFEINEKEISYMNTHIFTNKRYINIGVNFWQLSAEHGIMRGKITVDNYILSIPKEYFHSIQIGSEPTFIRVNLDDIVRIYFQDHSKYESFSKLLVENWDFNAEEIKSKEKKFMNLTKLKLLSYNSSILIAVLFLLIRNFSGLSENKLNSFWVISIIIFGCISIKEIIIILAAKKKKIFSFEFRLCRWVFYFISACIILLIVFSIICGRNNP